MRQKCNTVKNWGNRTVDKKHFMNYSRRPEAQNKTKMLAAVTYLSWKPSVKMLTSGSKARLLLFAGSTMRGYGFIIKFLRLEIHAARAIASSRSTTYEQTHFTDIKTTELGEFFIHISFYVSALCFNSTSILITNQLQMLHASTFFHRQDCIGNDELAP